MVGKKNFRSIADVRKQLTKKRQSPERQLQKSIIKYLEAKLPKVRTYVFAIPNGGSRHPVEAANLKQEGVTAGIPDLCMAIPSGNHAGFFMELKTGKNKLTPPQYKKINLLRNIGYYTCICYTLDEAIEHIIRYLSYGGGKKVEKLHKEAQDAV